jgi:iron complex transport system substrate-binding protein
MKFNTLLKSLVFLFLVILSCKEATKTTISSDSNKGPEEIFYAKGFTINKLNSDVTVITVHSPWPKAERPLHYALVPREKWNSVALEIGDFDAIIPVPITKYVATSTTHIPALEALGVLEKMVGFPGTDYISSERARILIRQGKIADIGQNESLNTEMTLALQPDIVIGFSVNASNSGYNTLTASHIPIVFNGDWTEESPLGKAEWVKFFAPFFKKEVLATEIFENIEMEYLTAKELAKDANVQPTVISGALYKDIWYLPGGKSWAAQFISDANANYLFSDNTQTGSLSLSWENVLQQGKEAEFWIGPAQFTSYDNMRNASPHYAEFKPFKNENIYTFAKTTGETGGVLYYELGPNRPDLVLKDLIHIFHPEVLPNYEPVFFKPLSK